MLKRLAGALIVMTALAAPARAQYANSRDGFWTGLGIGLGSVGVSCASCSNGTTSGTSAYLNLGGTLTPHFLVGGEATLWTHPTSGVDESVEFISLIAVWYPQAKGAFFFKFGAGGMAYTLQQGFDKLTATAPSASFGLGYNARIRPNFSLTPFVNALATSAVHFQINGAAVPSGEKNTLSLLQFGLGLSWH